MKTERPTSVLVLAILNVIWGVVGVVASLCLVGGTLAAPYLLPLSYQRSGPPPTPPRMDPVMVGYSVGNGGLTLVISALLLVTGIGFFSLRPWARRWCLAVAVVTILTTGIDLVLQGTVLVPYNQRYMEDIAAWQGSAPAPPPAQAGADLGAKIGMVIYYMASLLGVVYSIAQIVVLTRPAVRAAFARSESSSAGA